MTYLTTRQAAVFELIASAIAAGRPVPTIVEIGTTLGIRSTNGVSDHLNAIERKGYIIRDKAKSRSAQLTERGRAACGMTVGPTGNEWRDAVHVVFEAALRWHEAMTGEDVAVATQKLRDAVGDAVVLRNRARGVAA